MSSVFLTASMIRLTGSSIARRTSAAEITTVFGRPLTRSRPRISACGSSAAGNAEPMAAAIGAGLPINEPTGNMVVDIGGGTTEVAVISLGGIVTSQSIRIGGDEMDQAIITFGKKEYSLMLGERTAEELKMALGSAFPSEDEPHAEIRGRDLVSGLPKTVVISAAEVRRAIEEPLNLIIDAVKTTLDKCPPELAGDVMDRGIALTGGGALLRGLESRIREETGMPVQVADNPLDSVVLGTGKCVEDFETLRQVLVPDHRR